MIDADDLEYLSNNNIYYRAIRKNKDGQEEMGRVTGSYLLFLIFCLNNKILFIDKFFIKDTILSDKLCYTITYSQGHFVERIVMIEQSDERW